MPPRSGRIAPRALIVLAAVLSACQPTMEPSGPGPSAGGSGGSAGSGGSKAMTGGGGGTAPAPSAGTGGGGSGGSGGSPAPSPADARGAADVAPGADTAAADADGTPPDSAAVEVAADAGAAIPRASEACGKSLPAPTDGFHTLKVGNLQRRFFLRMPTGYPGNAPWPVLFGFHGAGNKTGSWFDTSTGLTRANRGNAVIILGESLFRPGSTSERSWQDEGQLPDNLAYVDAMIAWVKQNVCIDPGRLFGAGQSSGAYFVHTIACHRGDVIRAVASSDGGLRSFASCKGNPSSFIRYRPNTSATRGAEQKELRDYWLKHNACRTTGAERTGVAACLAYPGCSNESQVWECPDDGVHDWPDYMDTAVWGFFSRFK